MLKKWWRQRFILCY